MLGRDGRCRITGHDDVKLELNQLGRKSRQAPRLPLRPAILENYVRVLRVSEFAQPLPQRTKASRRVPRRQIEYSDPVHLGRRLSFRGRRRAEYSKREPAEERAPVHHSRKRERPRARSAAWSTSVEDGWRESSRPNCDPFAHPPQPKP